MEKEKYNRSRLRVWTVRLAWLIALWACSVTALGLVASALRAAMRAAGLTDA